MRRKTSKCQGTEERVDLSAARALGPNCASQLLRGAVMLEESDEDGVVVVAGAVVSGELSGAVLVDGS